MTYIEKFRLDGKVAFVTGAAGVLGQHFCRGLSEAGAAVVIADRNLAEAKALSNSIHSAGAGGTLPVHCDVTDPGSVRGAVEAAVKEFGAVHILHNNAAAKTKDLRDFFAPVEEFGMETWEEVMKVNLEGMFLVAQTVGKQMIKQGTGGSIIQTASIYGILAPDSRIYEGSSYLGGPINTPAVYSASKGGVVALTKYLAAYWADRAIRVNTLTPGGVASGQNDTFQRKYSARVPLGRMANPEEMVGALLFLASDASSYVTGQNIIVDGGLQAW